MAHPVTVALPGGEVSARIAGEGSIGVLLAHGAGTDQDHPSLVTLRDGLAARGLRVMTFNYPYRERGSARPDPLPRLVQCHLAAADLLGEQVERLFLAGRSMGGRVATHLAADGYAGIHGIVLYAYPLHPPGREDKLRADHLSRVAVPMLFFQGTRDGLSRMHLFDRHVATLHRATVVLVPGADHGFRVAGRPPDQVYQEVATRTADWIMGVSSGEEAGSGA